MKTPSLLLVVSTFAYVALADDKSQYLDMTYSFNNKTHHWPSYQDFELKILARGTEAFGIYVESNSFCMAEHTGTHMDSPAHFSEGKWRVHQVPLDALIGPAVRIDIKSKADANPDAEMEDSDIEAWEEANGRIPDDTIVMVYSGWGSRWGDELQYLGTDTGNTSALHFPGIGVSAAQVLIDRKVKAVGVDTASVDYGQSPSFAVHRLIFHHNIPCFENVANLDKLPNTGATIFAIPMKIDDGSGAPVRIFATGWHSDVPNPCSIGTGHQLLPYMGMVVFMLCASLFVV
ncbi:isatin hydrolase-like [Glandiceps talaboti]